MVFLNIGLSLVHRKSSISHMVLVHIAALGVGHVICGARDLCEKDRYVRKSIKTYIFFCLLDTGSDLLLGGERLVFAGIYLVFT